MKLQACEIHLCATFYSEHCAYMRSFHSSEPGCESEFRLESKYRPSRGRNSQMDKTLDDYMVADELGSEEDYSSFTIGAVFILI